MDIVGEKVTDFTTKWTSVTVTAEGIMVNEEADSGAMGTGLVTVTFRPPVDQSAETGPVEVQAVLFSPDGSSLSVTGAGTWRKSGHHKWEVRNDLLAEDGQRFFVVEEHDLKTRSTTGTTYAVV